MIRIAIQAKGRLNEQSVELLSEAGILIDESRRQLLTRANNFPIEALYLRDDDIPQAVAMGVADVGIVGLNEVEEKGFPVDVLHRTGFGKCRLSLAIPKGEIYEGVRWFHKKRVATSYPRILENYLRAYAVEAEIHIIAGSVEVAPSVGMAEAIFDIVSTGGTLVKNGLVEVEKVMDSEAVLIGCKSLSAEKQSIIDQVLFRFDAVQRSRGIKYVLMNLPCEAVERAAAILPGVKSPTILPLQQKGWCSMHVAISENDLWNRIESLKSIGAEGILVLSLEKMIP
ncbi:MAG: ATP phosphoribosyltransferase [Prevotellaceae bacterium]|jgi:ATP phosphoribosyltransferase|nr:ATP phosphoribosyltransferase [Prevotellaceae bacterium]